MKKIAMFFMFFVTVAVITLFGTYDTTYARERIPSIEDGTLVVRESPIVMQIPDVPKGLSAENAYKLVTGELKGVRIMKESGKPSFSFVFPSIRERFEYSDLEVWYAGGKFFSGPAPSRVEEGKSGVLTFALWIPAILILWTSIANALQRRGVAAILVFFVAIIVIIVASALVGEVTNGTTGVTMGLVIGTALGAFAGKFATKGIGIVLGGMAGVFIGIFAGGFGSLQNYLTLVHFTIFLLVTCAASFIIILVFHFVKMTVKSAESFNNPA